MSERGARRLAWSAFVLWILFFAGSVAFDLGTKAQAGTTGGDGGGLMWRLTASTFSIVAILILARQPRNRIGWILMAIGLTFSEPLAAYGEFAISRGLPGGVMSIAIAAPLWAPPIGLMGTVLLLRFPGGKLLSPRWRKVEWLAAFAISLTVVGVLIAPGDLAEVGHPDLANPFRIEALVPLFNALLAVVLLIPITVVASAVGVVMRFRRSTGTERLQMKWLTSAAAVVAVIYMVAMVASIDAAWGTPATPTWVAIIQTAATSSFVLIPIAIGFAVLRYRLYDIDLVINKTLVYGSLAGFITAVYVAVVVGIGNAIGTRGEPNLGLQIAATALVAVAFQPVRERIQRLANRLVYGRRASPYETLARFSDRVAGSYAAEDVLPRTARVLAEGTGAGRASVWVRVGDELRESARWPSSSGPGEPLLLDGEEVPDVPGAERTLAVRHGDQILGALAVTKAPGDPLRPQEEALLRDLASQAGLVLRNVRLTEELRERLEQVSRLADRLRDSRRRIVATQDAERRTLERNIHDGAQQHLVALAVQLNLARATASKDPEKARPLVAGLVRATNDALTELRDLARGIYPPLLEGEGIAAAIRAQAERAPVTVQVEAEGLGRYPPEVEAAAYFCILEALQNVAKYADATVARVRLRDEDGALRFEVRDDGRGFDPESTAWGSGLTNMTDRMAALGGTVAVDSAPGEGTTVSGTIRVRHREPVG